MKLYFFLFLSFSTITLYAQSAKDTVNISPTVVLHEDARIALIVSHPQTHYRHRARGFRVQIYNGSNRNLANQIKLDFMRDYPSFRAYLTYNKPQFRVRVGNFKSRGEAAVLYHLLSGKYSCMIVPEIITIFPTQNIED